MTLFLLLVALIGTVVLFFKSYNQLQSASQGVKETASNIDVMLRKKLELTSQLMDVCKGYADHEKLVLLRVSADQGAAVGELAEASGRADVAFAYLSQLGERFPDLKANASFQQLAYQLETLGNELQSKREGYNRMVSSYNSVRNLVPTVFVARLLGFSEAKHLDFGDAASMDVMRSFQTDDGARLEAFIGTIGSRVVHGTRSAVGRAAQLSSAMRSGPGGGPGTPPPAAVRYFYSENGVARGPVSVNQLVQLVVDGSIPPTAYVVAEGSHEWKPYNVVITPTHSTADGAVPPPPDAGSV